MKEERPVKPKATTEQYLKAYKKIAEWTKTTDKKESERVLEMLRNRKLK